MFQGQMTTLAISVMAFVAIGGVAWVFIYPLLSGERTAAKRIKSVAAKEQPTRAVRQRANEADKRRKPQRDIQSTFDPHVRRPSPIELRTVAASHCCPVLQSDVST